MKRFIVIVIFALLCAAGARLLPPAAELSYSFSMPYTDEQEACFSYNFAGRPAYSLDPDIQKTEKYISFEFFDYPGNEARFLLYIGRLDYDYNHGDISEAWNRLEFYFFPCYDAGGIEISILLP